MTLAGTFVHRQDESICSIQDQRERCWRYDGPNGTRACPVVDPDDDVRPSTAWKTHWWSRVRS
eukprot:1760048-Rhodomonas_salina.2